MREGKLDGQKRKREAVQEVEKRDGGRRRAHEGRRGVTKME